MNDDDLVPVAVALIRNIEPSGTRWLGTMNPATNTLRFVFSYPDGKSTMRQCLGEAVAWELSLNATKELVVSSMAQLNFDFPDSVPAIANRQPLRVAFYNVELYGKSAREKIANNPDCQWLSSHEIWNGVSEKGNRVDPLVQQLIAGSKVIQEWESSM